MSTKKKAETKTTQAQPSTNGPTFIAYQVIDRGEDQKGFWRAVGAAWAHKNGDGFTVQLEAFPLDGRLVLRAPLPKSES